MRRLIAAMIFFLAGGLSGVSSAELLVGTATTDITPEGPVAVSGQFNLRIARKVEAGIRRRRVLALMLGDTSMGMINGYFGPRLLNPIGFTEHKVDQAWIIDRGRRIGDPRIDAAMGFVKEKGVTFHYGEKDAEVLAKVAEVCDGLNLVIGPAVEDNYKKIGGAAIGYGLELVCYGRSLTARTAGSFDCWTRRET